MKWITKANIALLLSIVTTAPAQAVQEANGITPGGAVYRIAAPDDWQAGDGLVLIQHGFQFAPDIEPDLGPLRDRMLADGYAVAASGYRQRGWALFTARDDNAELLDAFRLRFGEPGALVMAGGSMGGLIALKLAEDARFKDRTAGVLALCPVADGVAAWDQAFDLRLAYDAICADVDHGQLPAGAQPTPWALDLDQLPADVDTPEDSDALLDAASGIALCTGLGLPDNLRTGGMRDRLAALQTIAETSDEDALLQQLAYAIIGLSDLLRSPDKLGGRNPFFNRVIDSAGTRDLDYRSDNDAALPVDLDRDIVRVTRDPFARLHFHRSSTLEGSASARIVSLHTQGDAVVPVWHQGAIRLRYADKPVLQAVALNPSPAHCAFTAPEVEAGWATLREWMMRSASPAPTIAELQAACVAAGPANECRFDPTLSAPSPPYTGRLRTTLSDVLAFSPQPVSGLWNNPGTPSQGVMFEELGHPVGGAPLGEQRVAMYWYTWAPAGDPAPGPRWLVGVGRSVETGVAFDAVVEVRGGRFGPLLDPAQLQFVPWGRVDVVFEPGRATLEYEASGAWGAGRIPLSQLTTTGFAIPDYLDLDPPPSELPFRPSGTYYDPSHPGQGWVLNQFSGSTQQSLLVGYTYDAAGNPTWLFGMDNDASDGLVFAMTQAVQGGTFENGATPAAPNLQPWGEVRLEVEGCDVVAVNWVSTRAGFGSGRVVVSRLTSPWLRHAPAAQCAP